ncbi:MAG: TIGR00730 family Rossman fold protein [Bacteroidaceae bacterium]|nr:TIGR00730 family Rossman fold protein [Bacteroidaceae bacterium]
MNSIRTISVYCASSDKINSIYFQAAKVLGEMLADRHIRVVNGAGSVGLMGALSDSVLVKGGYVIGVIPHFMVEQGWQHIGLSELIEVGSMHERKQKIADMSDATIALPGGCGTLEELLEIITWKQLGLYSHPVVILNINGYFDPLLEMFHKAEQGNFMNSYPTLFQVVCSPSEAMDYLFNISHFECAEECLDIERR